MEPVFYRDRRERAAYAAAHFPEALQGRVLDVGCGERHVAEFVRGAYVGLDRRSPADVRSDLERDRLPFEDASFDAVLCLDVLEHMDAPHALCSEMARVSRRWVLLSLPNAYDLTQRWSFVRGRGLPRRYGLPPAPPPERHKWVFGYSEARRFARARPDLRVARERAYYPPRGHGLGRWMAYLNRRGRAWWPDLLALSYWALLERMSGTSRHRVLADPAA
ncbi:MAG: class I SAM-dependent methyltransferase [Acidobacteriota bacterium]